MYDEYVAAVKKWIDTVEAVAQGNQFWLDHFISSLKQYVKPKAK